MSAGVRVRATRRFCSATPTSLASRTLTKEIWRNVPRIYRKGFQIEIALNYYTKKSGRKMAFGVMPGLSQVIKEKKRGFWLGLWQRIKMCTEVLWISFRLYVIRTLLDVFVPARRTKQRAVPVG